MTVPQLDADVLVFLEYGLSRETWASERANGKVNSGSPYGYAAAEQAVRMSWSRDDPETRSARIARRGIRKLLGFDLVHAWRHRADLREADVVWTHTERESLAALAVLRVLRNRTTQVIAQSVWLWDEWDSLSRVRRRMYRALLSRAPIEVTLSESNRERALRTRPGARVICVPFGAGINWDVAHEVMAHSDARSGGFVLAVGSDRHRDWRTLHDAARSLPGVQFRVATLSPVYPHESAPANVRVTPSESLEDSYGMYHTAALTVLPLTPNLHASGATVAIEAQALGSPLVTTDVGGIALYLGDRGVHLYEAGDSRSLADAITRVLEAGAAEAPDMEFVRRAGLTDEDYAARFVLLTRWLVLGGDQPRVVESRVETRSAIGS